MKVLTQPKHSGVLLGAAIIKKEQIKKCLKCKSKGLTVIKMEMAREGRHVIVRYHRAGGFQLCFAGCFSNSAGLTHQWQFNAR